MFTLKARKVGLNCLAFSPDGRTLAASGYRGVIQLWSLETRQLNATLQTANNCDCSVVFFLPDGKAVAVLNDGSLRLFDVRGGDSLGFRPEKDRRRNFCAAAVSPDRKRLCVAAGYQQSALEQYALPNFAPIWPRRTRGYGRATALSYSADGRFIACGRWFGQVVVADSATGTVHFERDVDCGEVKAVALSPDGQHAAWCAGTHLFLWRVDPAEEILRHRVGGRTFFLSVSWHPSGDFFATANGDGKVDYWDGRTGEHRQAFDWGVGNLHDVIFDATGDRAACCSKTGEIVVWDVDR